MKYILKYLLLLLFLVPLAEARPQVKFFMINSGGAPPAEVDGSIKLASGTASFTSSTPFDIDISSYTGTYKKITVRLYDLISTVSTDGVHLQVSPNGTTFDAGSTDYKALYHIGDASGGLTAPYLNIIPSNLSNTAGEIHWVDISIVNAGSSADRPTFRWEGSGTDNLHNPHPITGGGIRVANQATLKLRFLSNGGTITTAYEVRGE
jgi:hypothetical protein